MYKEGTTPQRFRLSDNDLNICKNYLQVPLGRVLNRALGIYIYNIQHDEVIPATLLYSGTNTERRSGNKTPVSVRLRRDLVEYMEQNCINKTRAIEEALSRYIGHVNTHPSELDALREGVHYWLRADYPKY